MGIDFLDLAGDTMAGVGGLEAPKIVSQYTAGMKDYAEAQMALKKLHEVDRKIAMEDLALKKQKEEEPYSNALKLQKLNLRPIKEGEERPPMDVNDPNGWLQKVSGDIITDSESDVLKQEAAARAAIEKIDYQNDRVDRRTRPPVSPEDKERAGQVKSLLDSIDKNFKFVNEKASKKKKDALIGAVRQLQVLGDDRAYNAVYARYSSVLQGSGLPAPTQQKITLKEPVEIMQPNGQRAQIMPEAQQGQAPKAMVPNPTPKAPPKGAAPVVFKTFNVNGQKRTFQYSWDGVRGTYVRGMEIK